MTRLPLLAMPDSLICHTLKYIQITTIQIPARQEKDPRKRYCSHPEDSPACSLRSCRLWNVFLDIGAQKMKGRSELTDNYDSKA